MNTSMRATDPAGSLRLIATALVVALALVLSACGGGTTTAGVGGSGIGGTGITRVAGNVAQVVSESETAGSTMSAKHLLAAAARWISDSANAEAIPLKGIRVSGGGVSTLTDGNGDFVLEGFTPGPDASLTFSFPDDKPDIELPIGDVPAGAEVQVNDVVLDTARGTAAARSIEVRSNPGGGKPDEPGKPDSPGNSGQAGPPDGVGKPDQPGNSGNANEGQGQDQSNNGQGQDQSNNGQGQ